MNEAGPAKAKREAFVIPSLDGIRALSFMDVFLAHTGFPYIPGGFGVTVFFFLSGYLITTLLRKEAESSGRISFKLFYLRRALRILPPFYLVLGLALSCALVGLLPGPISIKGLVAQVLHYSNYWVVWHGWDGLVGGTGPYWSLAVEEHFYLLFPALFVLLLKLRASPRAQHHCLLGLCAVVMLWRCWIVFHDGNISDRTYVASDTRFDSMLFGCALAVWKNPAVDFARGAKTTWLELAAAAAGAGILLVTFVVRDPAFRESIRYSLQGIGLYPLFFVAIRHPELLVCRFLNLRWVRFFGTLSYSLYLVHQVVIHVLLANLHLNHLVFASLTFVISLLLALGIWRYVEKPFAKLRGQLASAASRGAVVPTAGA
jgi:peptidoglycan/LPS O-acetylase OafA/YrhL